MPAFETMDRPQKITYWERLGTNRLGNFVIGSPIELKVQWDDRASRTMDSKGNWIGIDGTLFTNRVLKIGSIVRLGTISDWQGTGSGLVPTDLMEIKTGDEVYDLKGRNQVFFYGMMRYTDSLPIVGAE